jgi:hypothetical protein
MSARREAKQRRQRERDAAKRPLQPLDLDGEGPSQRRRRLSREALGETTADREQWMQERANRPTASRDGSEAETDA